VRSAVSACARLLPVLILTVAAVACRRPPSPEVRARQVGSWLTATSGVVSSWAAGSISAAAAESNLESTARTIDDVSREGLPESMAGSLSAALRHIAEAQEAVRVGDKTRAATKAEDIAALARALGSSASGVQ